MNSQSDVRLTQSGSVTINGTAQPERFNFSFSMLDAIEFVVTQTGTYYTEQGCPYELIYTPEVVTVRNTNTGATWIFDKVGASGWRLRSYGPNGSSSTFSYNYDENDRLTQITTPSPQADSIQYLYNAAGLVEQIVVLSEPGTANPTTKHIVQYTYFDSNSMPNDVGSEGDLVQVVVSTLMSDGAMQTETTQYRYDANHKITHIFDDEAIQRALIASGNSSPDELLDLPNVDSNFNFQLFASQRISYYGQNQSGTFTTGFSATEDLIARYGASEASELGMVSSISGGSNGSGCSSCGDSEASKKVFYLNLGDGPSTDGTRPWTTAVRLVVEDTIDQNGNGVYRDVRVVNDQGRILRQATITDPLNDQTTPTVQYLCSARTYEQQLGKWRVANDKEASLFSSYVVNQTSFKEFLAGTYGGNANDGLIRYYEYDSAGHAIATKISKGTSGTPYYISYLQFTNDRITARWIVNSPQTSSSQIISNLPKITYAYTLYPNSDNVATITRTSPAISSSQNGSGVASQEVEYYDESGRLRWTRDGEGRINYYSYDPNTNSQTYRVTDVNTSNSAHFSPTTTRLAWSSTPPFTSQANALDLVYQSHYDDQGRLTSTISPEGKVDVTKYFTNGTAHYSYVTGTTAALPVSITKTNAAGQVTDQYTFMSSEMETVGESAEVLPTDQEKYLSWTRYFYDSVSGELVKELTYHNIPDSGDGSHLTHYHVTAHQYDAMGRESVTIQTVQSDSGYQDQISRVTYDNLGRQVKTERGVGNSGVNTGANGTLGTLSLSGLATVSESTYDAAGRVVSSKSFYGTGSTSYIESIPKYNYRGQVRGSTQNNGGTSFGPYQVRDLDWMGRTVASATYTSEPDWTTVLSTDNFVATTSTNRNNLSKQYYDDLGRVYRTERFPGTEGTNHFASNTFYDRNGRMVASQQVNGMAQEVAYDGAGRQYQSRTVQALSSTKYSSGAYIYVAPTPNPTLTSMSGGDGGVIAMSHSTFNADGNVLGQHSFEVNSGDSNGLSLSTNGQPSDGVRTTVYNWYDSADRLVTTADFGCGVGNADNWWRASALPAYTEPAENNSNVQLTKFTYNADTGRQETVKSWQTATASSTSKTFYDDLGRRTFQVDNHSDFEGSPNTGIGGGTNNEQDVVVGWQYNGLGQVTKLTAYNANTESGSMLIVPQETEYQYRDPYNASLVTLEKYPDGTLTGSDNIQKTYHLDGSLNTRTDQRGVTLTYTFDTARRVTLEAATNLSSDVDNHVQAIGRTYDSLGRVTKVTSYAGTTTGSTVRNEVETVYNTLGQVVQSYQAHGGATSVSSPSVQYAYDTSAVSNVYDDALRPTSTTYPNGSRQILYHYGSSGSRSDLLSRMEKIQEGSTDLTQYAYNGTGRLVNTKLLPPGVESLTGTSSSNFSYLDQWGRVLETRWFKSSISSHVDSVLYTYDRAGNRLQRDVQMNFINNSEVDDRDQVFTYDLLNRLKSAEQGGGAGVGVKLKQAWGLDQLGNWSVFQQDGKNDYSSVYNNSYTDPSDLDQQRKHNSVNEIAVSGGSPITVASGQTGWAIPNYDAAGNMVSMLDPTDLYDGSPTGSNYYATYDAWNRLTKINRGSQVLQINRYDGLHRRVSRTSDASGTRHFYWNESWQCVEERVDASTTADRQYVWHPYYIDALAISYNSSGTAHTYVQDGNFNVTAAMDSSGAVVERYSYTPYGECIVLNADFTLDSSSGGDGLSDIANEFTYTGRRLDVETGLYQYRHRYYHAQLGRFVNRDPIGYEGSEWNLFVGFSSNPVNRTDPTGLIDGNGNGEPPGWAGKPVKPLPGYRPPNYIPPAVSPIRGGGVSIDFTRTKSRRCIFYTELFPVHVNAIPLNGGILTQYVSQEHTLNVIKQKQCCEVIFLGHQGGDANAGGVAGIINCNPYDGFGLKLRTAFNAAGCNGCGLILAACGRENIQATTCRQKLADDSGCDVYGTKKKTPYYNPNPEDDDEPNNVNCTFDESRYGEDCSGNIKDSEISTYGPWEFHGNPTANPLL